MRSLDFESKTKPIVYVDMDGVLADFFGEVAKEHDVGYWREIHRKDLGIDQVAQQPDFFAGLSILPNAGRLMSGILHLNNDRYSILSSPLLSNVEESSKEKMAWLQRHLKNHQPQAVIFDHEKYKFACQADGTPNILIDDWETNIRLWESNGGIGILYRDTEYKQALQKLKLALHGQIEPQGMDLSEESDVDAVNDKEGELYTSRQVLKYVQGIHHEYHMPKPILAHKTWVLKNIPISSLKTPEFVHQDDPYRRVIDINWDHVEDIQMQDIKNRPIVADANGWILDGNHRLTAARARGLDTIPALVPYDK
jgi:5'(3')-deoxyribonucleotidase